MAFEVIQSLKLSTPVTEAGVEKQFVDIVKPTVGIFRTANKLANGDQTELAMLMAEKCSGLSSTAFNELQLTDSMAIIEVLSPFLDFQPKK